VRGYRAWGNFSGCLAVPYRPGLDVSASASPLAFDHPSLFQLVTVPREMPMAEIEWKPLPTPMWPEGSVMADWSDLILEASFEQSVPAWKVQRSMGKNALPTLVASGTADSFAAAKAAALHVAEAELRSSSQA
jgi:hypothetical protein